MRKRTLRLTVRFTEEELAHVRQLAITAGCSKEELIRKLLSGTQLTSRPPEELTLLIRELNAIGNNLNQIARIANTKQAASKAELTAARLLLQQIWEKVLEL